MSSPKHYSTCKKALTDSALVSSLATNQSEFVKGVLFRGAWGRIDQSAPTDTYYIQVLDAASLPSNGAVTHLVSPTAIVHTQGVHSTFNIDVKEEYLKARYGVVLAVSTTEFTLTVDTSDSMSATILYK